MGFGEGDSFSTIFSSASRDAIRIILVPRCECWHQERAAATPGARCSAPFGVGSESGAAPLEGGGKRTLQTVLCIAAALVVLHMVAEVEAAPTASRPLLLPHLITGIYSLIFLGPMVGPFGGASTFFDDLCLPIRLLSLFEIGGSRPRSTHIAYASAYHQEQRPHILLSAARFQMNDYFGHIHGSAVPSLSCSALSLARSA